MNNIKAQEKALVYKTVFVSRNKESNKREEKYIKVGTHAECNAALSIAELEAKQGKYDLAKGHFAMVVATDNEVAAYQGRPAERVEIPTPAKAEPKAKAPAKAEMPVTDGKPEVAE